MGDLVDRLSILQLKIENLPGEDVFQKEKEAIERAIQEKLDKHPNNKEELEKAKQELYKFNKVTWGLEADIRQGKEKELGLEEVGRRALKIRDNNTNRINAKNRINELFDSGFKEIKVNHRSE